MYKIEHIKTNPFHQIKLMNSKNNSFAKISLQEGGSMLELCINNTSIIKDLSPLKYANTYASSILFPFANRIKDGIYNFNQKEYQFEINQQEENNALHGLVYNKNFEILSENVTENEASVKLIYTETNKAKGFPYTYTIQLQYTLTATNLKLNVSVKNTDSKPFPFTIGWHPYFYSKNLYSSHLNFDSTKKAALGDRMITTGIEPFEHKDKFEIKDKQLDDCFILNSNKIQFTTPNYTLEMGASSKETFLQLYTPNRSTIAIEPTTGVSDSFNNKIGLQILDPDDIYTIDWNIKATTND